MSDPTSLPSFPPPADEHPLRGRVLDVLVDMGAQPNLDTDGDVAYQANEQTIFVRVTEGDLPVMRVFGQWTLPDEVASDADKVSATCNEVNLSLNCVKTGVANNTLLTVLDLLHTADDRSWNGVLWDRDHTGSISATEQAWRNMANTIFSAINTSGDIT
jgi:hypothetical protein